MRNVLSYFSDNSAATSPADDVITKKTATAPIASPEVADDRKSLMTTVAEIVAEQHSQPKHRQQQQPHQEQRERQHQQQEQHGQQQQQQQHLKLKRQQHDLQQKRPGPNVTKLFCP
jgi:hypothetical protein